MLYQQSLTWYYEKTKEQNFNYKNEYQKLLNRTLDEHSCPIISEVGEDYYLRESFLKVFSKVVNHAILNKIYNAHEIIYGDNHDLLISQKTKLGELIFSKIIYISFRSSFDGLSDNRNDFSIF